MRDAIFVLPLIMRYFRMFHKNVFMYTHTHTSYFNKNKSFSSAEKESTIINITQPRALTRIPRLYGYLYPPWKGPRLSRVAIRATTMFTRVPFGNWTRAGTYINQRSYYPHENNVPCTLDVLRRSAFCWLCMPMENSRFCDFLGFCVKGIPIK